ncbi:DUF229 domain-containing protein [Verrucomicrobia bacterium S94]|nr:DUF229 domain-containing protein [Verrucomicrobia bacterium S94]
MNRRDFTRFAAVGTTAVAGGVLAEKSRQPNILWIITDEHNFRTLGCYRKLLDEKRARPWGETVVETPNIDWLADNGAVFTQMYSSSPVCSPCRSSMFTGQYPQTVNMPRNDMVMDERYPTIASVLSEAGYHTGYSGKWHLSGEAKPGWEPKPCYGFQDNRYMFNRGHWKKMGFEKSGVPCVAARDAKGRPSYQVDGADEKSFTTDWLADRTIEFIEEHKTSPFYYVCSIPDPHGPNSVREPYSSMYKDVEFEIPESFYYEIRKDDPKWRAADPTIKGEQTLREIYPQYYGMVKCIDDNVGRIVNKLKAEGLLENTIILFASDHGDLMGEHHRLNKGVPYEGSAKIPFVLYYPKAVPAGTRVTKAANATDWMETFLSLAGVKNRPKTAGRDLTPLIHNDHPKNWDDITFSRMGGWIAAFDSRYKLILDNTNAGPWLMDNVEDPEERYNLYGDPAYKAVIRHLAQKLKGYVEAHNEPLGKNDKVMKKLNAALSYR